MTREIPFEDGLVFQPWFTEAVGRLHLRKGARVLMLTAASPELCRHVLSAVGKDGHLTVLEPDADRAARVDRIEHPGLAVIVYRPEGTETFGQHDALIACPATDPGWPMNVWSELAKHNLRLGGRLVIDLPGAPQCEAIETAWGDSTAPTEALEAWNGPGAGSIARVLASDGLRAIEPQVATHLVTFASPHDAAILTCVRLGLEHRFVDELQLALAKRFKTNDELEVLFRRTRVTAMR